MVTIAFSQLVALLLLAFAVQLLFLRRYLHPEPTTQRVGWEVTGTVFIVYAVSLVVQVAMATIAFFAGAEHPFYTFYIKWAPVQNHARTILMFGYYALLALLPSYKRLRRVWPVLVAAVIVVTSTLGAVYGYWEGPLLARRHFSATAIIDTGGFVVLGSVLMFLLIRNTVDRYLWFCVAAYGFTSIIGALYLMALSWLDLAGAWTPPHWHLPFARAVFAAVMVALVWRRLYLARRGRPVPGLLESGRPRHMLLTP